MTHDLFSIAGLPRSTDESEKQDKAAARKREWGRLDYLAKSDEYKARAKARRDADPEAERQRARDYAAEHKAEAVERTRAWRKANAEKYKADGAAYREKKRREKPVDPKLAIIEENYRQAPEEYRALPRTAEDARASGSKQYFSGQTCPKGHIGPRYTKKRVCVQCAIDDAMKRYGRISEESKTARNEYFRRRYHSQKVLKGREHLKGPQNGNYCGERRCPAARPMNRLLHYHANREAYYAAAAGRRGRMRNGIPAEYRDELNRIYAECPPGHVVDHIVPLNGKTVSGLHIPCNLQYLPVEENKKKSARFTEADGIDYTAPAWRAMA